MNRTQHEPSRPRLRDDFVLPLRTVAGLVIQSSDACNGLHVHAVLMDATSFAVLARESVEAEHLASHDPCDIAFALIALRQALHDLGAKPDLLLLDETTCRQPSDQRVASLFGKANDLPCIGISRNKPAGQHMPLHEMRGAFAPLREAGEQVGWALRSQPEADPLYVWPGYRVAMASSAELLMRFVREDRLPEPLRI